MYHVSSFAFLMVIPLTAGSPVEGKISVKSYAINLSIISKAPNPIHQLMFSISHGQPLTKSGLAIQQSESPEALPGVEFVLPKGWVVQKQLTDTGAISITINFSGEGLPLKNDGVPLLITIIGSLGKDHVDIPFQAISYNLANPANPPVIYQCSFSK